MTVLDNPENWQLSYAAAESLGRLGDARAEGALAAARARPLCPPVRESARKARAAIAAGPRALRLPLGTRGLRLRVL